MNATIIVGLGLLAAETALILFVVGKYRANEHRRQQRMRDVLMPRFMMDDQIDVFFVGDTPYFRKHDAGATD